MWDHRIPPGKAASGPAFWRRPAPPFATIRRFKRCSGGSLPERIMPLSPSIADIVIRILLTVIASAAIGLERGERGLAVGLRSSLLVALAACFAMVLGNLLLNTVGKAPNSFVNFDIMRLPLGILSGVGFIGGGAI